MRKIFYLIYKKAIATYITTTADDLLVLSYETSHCRIRIQNKNKHPFVYISTYIVIVLVRYTSDNLCIKQQQV